MRKCRRCGDPIDNATKYQCVCSVCRKKSKNTTLEDRVCCDCGETFKGGPRAFRCPDCSLIRRRILDIECHRRQADRKWGSVDQCQVCGKDYIVKSGRQKYCPECAPDAIKKSVSKHKKEYGKKNADAIKEKKLDRKRGVRICAVCGEPLPEGCRRVAGKMYARVSVSDAGNRIGTPLLSIGEVGAKSCRSRREIMLSSATKKNPHNVSSFLLRPGIQWDERGSVQCGTQMR